MFSYGSKKLAYCLTKQLGLLAGTAKNLLPKCQDNAQNEVIYCWHNIFCNSDTTLYHYIPWSAAFSPAIIHLLGLLAKAVKSCG